MSGSEQNDSHLVLVRGIQLPHSEVQQAAPGPGGSPSAAGAGAWRGVRDSGFRL